jgi:hypothetical protein
MKFKKNEKKGKSAILNVEDLKVKLGFYLYKE